MEVSTTSFFNKIANSLENGLPMVAYRLPNKNAIKGIIQPNDALNFTNDYKDKGFLFAPFDTGESAVIIPEAGAERIEMAGVIEIENSERKLLNIEALTKSTYLDLIKKAITTIGGSELKKVVLSRKEQLVFDNFDAIATFKRILNTYSNAMCYLWYHPKIGMWLGASPETLISVHTDKFRTMALAGTQKYCGNLDVLWGKKEIREQQIVTEEIREGLRNLAIKHHVSETKTVQAGSLIHLRTDISGKVPPTVSLKQLIKSLHPTPAICGLPKEKAKEFILAHENYKRTYYTGFLGELNLEKSSNLYVNLRCLEKRERTLSIYVGGGITAESEPEGEWAETLAKCEIMLRVL